MKELKEKIIEAVQDATDTVDGTVSIPILNHFLDEILTEQCNIADVVNRRELLLDWEKHSYGSEWSMHEDQIVPSIDEYLSQ